MILKNTIKKNLSQDLTIEQVNTIEGELISGKTLTEILRYVKKKQRVRDKDH